MEESDRRSAIKLLAIPPRSALDHATVVGKPVKAMSRLYRRDFRGSIEKHVLSQIKVLIGGHPHPSGTFVGTHCSISDDIRKIGCLEQEGRRFDRPWFRLPFMFPEASSLVLHPCRTAQ